MIGKLVDILAVVLVIAAIALIYAAIWTDGNDNLGDTAGVTFMLAMGFAIAAGFRRGQ